MRYGTTICALLSLAWNAGVANLWAQTPARHQVHVVGRIFDDTRRSVEGVEVVVNGGEVRGRTDSTGIFNLDVFPNDSTVGFRRIGYRPLLLSIRPLPPSGDTILVRLVASPVSLAEVMVSGAPTKPLRYAGTTKYDEVFLRRRIGLGILITREDIEARVVFATHELLQGAPGVRVWNGPPKRIRFVRCQDPGGISIFVDGVRLIPNAGSGDRTPPEFAGSSSREDEPEIEVLSRINPSDVEMIEVYRGVSEIPGVFHWNGCAVVAIWTRWNR